MTLNHWNFSYFYILLHRLFWTVMPTRTDTPVSGNELGVTYFLIRGVGGESIWPESSLFEASKYCKMSHL